MNNDKAQGVRGEVLSILVNSPTTEEIRKSVISETQRASLRHGSTAGTQYDQVSSGEMLRRFREQSLLQRKQSNAVAMETVQDTAHKVVETSRSEDYVIEVPKSGLFDRDEYLIPLYLPTGCSPDQKETTDNSEIDAQKLSVDELAKAAARPIRTLVYCEDDVLFTEYLQEHNLYGASKPLWGLQFDSKFECGNLYKAESVQHRGAPLGAPEEYELTIRPDIYNPSNNSNLTTSKSDSAATAAADSEVGRASLAGGSQWYFFRVMNTKKRTYRFHIGPFSHDVPALRRGMRPVMISEQAYKQEGMGWQRVGQNVIFERNRVTGAYTLSFTFTNEIAKDVLYFAFAPPYTYTQLQNMLYTLAKDDSVRQHFSVRPLCRTLGGNRCDVVTIAENITPARSLAPPESASGFSGSGNAADNTGTSGRMSSPRASAVGRAAGTARSSNAGAVAGGGVAGGAGTTGVETVAEEGDEAAAVVPDFLLKMQRLIQTEKNAKEIKIAEDSRKKIIFITARAHGGETASSWMCEGVIKFLLGDSPTAVELRKAAIFYIIPMLNIDGVVNGFSKRDICGSDLNENWESPSITLHSTLYHTKLLIKQAQASGALFAFFDLHVQAVKDGVAFYSVMPPLTEMQQYYQKVTKLHHQDEKKDIKPTTAAAAASSSALPVSGVLDITKQADPRNYNLAAARRSPLVNLKCCAVKAGAHKAGSARVVAANEFRFPISMTVEASFHLSLTHKKHTAKQLVSSDYARFGCILCIALADVMNIGCAPVDTVKTEKLSRVRRASLAVSALSKIGSIKTGNDAIVGALAQVRLAEATGTLGMGTDTIGSSSRGAPFVSAVSSRNRDKVAKTGSFAIGSSARITNTAAGAATRASVTLQVQPESAGAEMETDTIGFEPATKDEGGVDVLTTSATDGGGGDGDNTNIAQLDQHVHYFSDEEIDPAAIGQDPNLQLHFNEDIWETRSDSSDMEVPTAAPQATGTVTVTVPAGRTTSTTANSSNSHVVDAPAVPVLNETIAWNLRRADELGLLKVFSSSISAAQQQQLQAQQLAAATANQRATFRDRVPKQAPVDASFEAKPAVHFAAAATTTAGEVDSCHSRHSQHSPRAPVPPSATATAAGAPRSPVAGGGGSAFAACKSPVRGIRKNVISPDRIQTALLSSAVLSPSPEASPNLFIAPATATAATAAGADLAASPTGQYADGISTGAEQEVVARPVPFHPHAPKKGVIKVSLARDPTATAAQGGLVGKAIGESKGLVSFTVQVHSSSDDRARFNKTSTVHAAAAVGSTTDDDNDKIGFEDDDVEDKDLMDPTDIAFSEHMSIVANHVSRKRLTNDHHSVKKHSASTSAKMSASRKVKSDFASISASAGAATAQQQHPHLQQQQRFEQPLQLESPMQHEAGTFFGPMSEFIPAESATAGREAQRIDRKPVFDSPSSASVLNKAPGHAEPDADPLVSALNNAMDVVIGTANLSADNKPGEVAAGANSASAGARDSLPRSSSPTISFSPRTVPVQGIDPLNNSMSPLFSLYSGTAPLYSERVSERILLQQQEQDQQSRGQSAEQGQPQQQLQGTRLTSPPLNTRTVGSAGYVRSSTPPRSGARSRPAPGDGAPGGSQGQGQGQLKPPKSADRPVITLPYVRLAPGSVDDVPIVFFDDEVFADETHSSSVQGHASQSAVSASSGASTVPQQYNNSRIYAVSPVSGPAPTYSAGSGGSSAQRQPASNKEQRPAQRAMSKLAAQQAAQQAAERAAELAAQAEKETMQAQFLHDMGLDYDRLFGPQGIMRTQKKNIKLHRSQEPSPLITNEKKNEIAGAEGVFSSAFPLRRAVYEKEVVELRHTGVSGGTGDAPGHGQSVAPVLVRQGPKGVGGIRPPQQDRVYLRHQLDQYFHHVEESLRARQLVEESATAITARKIFDMVHQVNLLDEREVERMKLQETIQRKWLARGGKWKHKHRLSNTRHNGTDGIGADPHAETKKTGEELPESAITSRVTPVTPRSYANLRSNLKSHGSAEGSILQHYQEYIGGGGNGGAVDVEGGNGWQWLTSTSPVPVPTGSPHSGSSNNNNNHSTNNNISIPTVELGNREDIDTPGLDGREGGGEGGGAGDGAEVDISMGSKPLLVPFKIDTTYGKPNDEKKKAVQVLQAQTLGFDLERQNSKKSRVSVKSGGIDVFLDSTELNTASYATSQELQDAMYQSVLNSTVEAQNQEHKPKRVFYHNGLYYRFPPSPAEQPVRQLRSPPRARIDFFAGRSHSDLHSHSPQIPVTHVGGGADGEVAAQLLSHDVGLEVVKPHRRLVDVTLQSAASTIAEDGEEAENDDTSPGQDLQRRRKFEDEDTEDNEAGLQGSFIEEEGSYFQPAVPHTSSAPLSAGQQQQAHSEAEDPSLQRIDSEYARYLRHGEICRRSILGGSDAENQIFSLHASGHTLPTAAASTATTTVANAAPESVVASLKSNPLLSQRLQAIAAARQRQEQHRRDLLDAEGGNSVELLARNIHQSANVRHVQLEPSVPFAIASEPKVISPRRPLKEKQSEGDVASSDVTRSDTGPLSVAQKKLSSTPAAAARQSASSASSGNNKSPKHSPRRPKQPVPSSPSFAAGTETRVLIGK